MASLSGLIEISQIRWLLTLFCGHQVAIRAEKIILFADADMIVVFIAALVISLDLCRSTIPNVHSITFATNLSSQLEHADCSR
jgi:hypothetical protein